MFRKMINFLCLTVGAAICACAHLNPAYAVDGIVLITQARAFAGDVTPGDEPGFPVTISLPGSYRLASNLDGTGPDINVIEITASNVSLDLNGFTVFGPGFVGITSNPEIPIGNISISNGTISGMTSTGMLINSGLGKSGFFATRIRAVNNGVDGISMDGPNVGAVIENSFASGNGRHGIVMTGVALDPKNGYGIARGNLVTLNMGIGLVAAEGSLVVGNTAYGNRSGGIQAWGGNTIKDNTCYLNGKFGIHLPFKAGNSLLINNNTSQNHVGIIMESGGLLDGNTAFRNSGFGFILTGEAAFTNNVLTVNNGGPEAPQVQGGVELGTDTNLCGTNTTCP